MRAVRAIPQFREIACAVKQYAPDAWIVNYTNPGPSASGRCIGSFRASRLLAVATRCSTPKSCWRRRLKKRDLRRRTP
ncbi:MAG: hypothetical protein LBL45_04335 [Treponema sp.]|nr:hypothetical protein [Treponema sp.]